MRTWILYAKLQLPDLVLVCVLLATLYRMDWLSGLGAWGLLGIWLLKDALIFPLVAPVLQREPLLGAERMIGERVLVVRDLDPEGQVKLRGELWRAHSISGPIAAGASAHVVEVRGLTLRVASGTEHADSGSEQPRSSAERPAG